MLVAKQPVVVVELKIGQRHCAAGAAVSGAGAVVWRNAYLMAALTPAAVVWKMFPVPVPALVSLKNISHRIHSLKLRSIINLPALESHVCRSSWANLSICASGCARSWTTKVRSVGVDVLYPRNQISALGIWRNWTSEKYQVGCTVGDSSQWPNTAERSSGIHFERNFVKLKIKDKKEKLTCADHSGREDNGE